MTKTVRYRLKLTESQLCVMINTLNSYRKTQPRNDKINDLLLKLLDSLEQR